MHLTNGHSLIYNIDMNNTVGFDKNIICADIEYYAVFCTYRRRKVFTGETIICRFNELVDMCMKEMKCEKLSLTVKADHVVIKIRANASLSPASIFFNLRHSTSSVLRQEFEFLYKTTALWGRKLLLSTKAIQETDYLLFLDEQRRRSGKTKNGVADVEKNAL